MPKSKDPKSQSDDPKSDDRRVFWWNVIASVVASVVFIALIQPLLTLLWDFLTSTGNSVINLFVDHLYKNASLGERNWVVVAIALILLNVPMGLILFASLGVLRFRASGPGSRVNLTVSRVARSKLIFAALAIGGVLCSIYMSTSIFTDLQLNTSFSQRLSVLAPYIDDHQVKVLRGNWASMTSKADYRAIHKKMETLATQSGIKLPPPLLPD